MVWSVLVAFLCICFPSAFSYFPVVIFPTPPTCFPCDEMASYFSGLLPPNHKPSLIMKKNSEESQLRDVLLNTSLLLLKTFKDIKNNKRLRTVTVKRSLKRFGD